MSSRLFAFANLLIVAATAGLVAADPAIELVSRTTSGASANGSSFSPGISSDGRYVAFVSSATDLAPGSNGKLNALYVRDRTAGTTTRLAASTSNDGFSIGAFAISDDGRWVLFSDSNDGAAPGDTNGMQDVFLHDRATGATRRVSIGPGGVQPNSSSYIEHQAMSADGRWIVFAAQARFLPGDPPDPVFPEANPQSVYLYDRDTATVRRVAYGDGEAISADGRWISLVSEQALVASDTNGRRDAYLVDRVTGGVRLLPTTDNAGVAYPAFAWTSISGDGRYVAFNAEVAGGNVVVVADSLLGSVQRVTPSSTAPVDTQAQISRDGQRLLLETAAALAPADSDGALDAYRWDRNTGGFDWITRDVDGANFGHLELSDDGRMVVSWTEQALTAQDANGQADVYLFVHPDPTAALYARVNFQPAGAAVPTGYLPDSGATYAARGNGFSYGWNVTTNHARDRNSPASPDQRYDTLNHLNAPGNPRALWEIAVPNGDYAIQVVCGDPTVQDANAYRLLVEGVPTVVGRTTSARRWLAGNRTVTVADGRLTVTTASPGTNEKICFIDLHRLTPAPAPGGGFVANVNFQPAGVAIPAGYLADNGQAFAPRGGLYYGWNAAITAATRDRNHARSPDQRYDTLIHTQAGGAYAVWEMAVPNGLYEVHVVGGDPAYFDSTFRLNVESTLALSGTTSSAAPWREATVEVTVGDGRLTLANAPGAVNSKLDFVDIAQIPTAIQ
ncbi:MAG: PD40 domain-containing protein [Planctomycetes bacterium]|nr:PD40 domain-containing protein [Planctomycetota bacterium]